MKKFLFISISIAFLSACSLKNSKSESEKQNPFLADPTIFYWEGVYYLYGTAGIMSDETINKDEGFLVYTSSDLENWEGPNGASNGFALRKGESYGTKGFWAPQVFHYKDKFYMAYTADSHIAIASAPSPLGPFRQDQLKPLSTVTRQIDPYVFIDEDGKIYMYHVRLIEANRLFVAELNDDLSEMNEKTLTECLFADSNTWEDTADETWKVAEGPTIIKEAGKYYFFYSANHFRNIDYAVGYATADSPYGPWTKNVQNPVIDRHLIKENGTGHGDVFFNDKNEMYYVFHTHFSDKEVAPRKTAIVQLEKMDSNFKVKSKTFRFFYVKQE